MTYIEEFEKELRKKLEAEEPADAIVSWCREKILQSYRNGASAVRTRARSPRTDSKEEKKSTEAPKESAQALD
jgi:hypothetical protein